MCGIAGYCLSQSIQPSISRLEGLLKGIRRRGPDDEGVCLIARKDNTCQFLKSGPNPFQQSRMEHDIALVHTRFSIIDLSEKGHQPFMSQDGSIIAVFNGEIYNYVELRMELIALGVRFRTKCDTEVLVEGYAYWREALWPKLNGFWAVVIYDRHKKHFILSRDRVGVAPLYYRQTPQGLFFCSYINPLLDVGPKIPELNDDAISGFLQTGFKDVDDETYYEGIKSVPAACFVTLTQDEGAISKKTCTYYWRLPQQRLSEKDISLEEAVDQFRTLFFNAVEIRMRADVKIAFELSGGLDSSSIVAAAAMGGQKLTTYTASIDGADEEPYARTMREKYDMDYHVLSNMENNFIEDYASFSNLMEEPFDNPNAYTHYRMLKAIKEDGIKVILTGAGGDEVFAGYEASFWPKAYEEWKKTSLFQADLYEFCRRYKTKEQAYKTLKHYVCDLWKRFAKTNVKPVSSLDSKVGKQVQRYPLLSFDEQRRFHFTVGLLPFYMRSSDHFTMGIPIEHRFPLLDYRLVEFGLRLPISYLFHQGWTKYILRKAMSPYLPDAITWRRKKMGFQFPYELYFKKNYSVFGPLLQDFYKRFPRVFPVPRSYAELLTNDPLLLWRLLSTSIWMNQRPKGKSQ